MAYNILIVDDSAVTREVMERSCRLSGLEVGEIYHAADGRQALAVLESKWADIIFSDVNMPVMDGCQLVAALATQAEWTRVPVVIVSTEGSSERIEDLRRLGVSAFIHKPFTPEQVAAVVRRIMGVVHA